MKRFLIYLSVIPIMVSCYNLEKPEKPEDLIAKDKMVNVIIDMSLLSAAKGVNKKTLENNGIYPLDYVYKKYNIDSVQFINSNAYYTYYIDDYEAIYKRVKDSLSKLKKKYRSIEEIEKKEKRKRDSIKREKNSDSLNLKKTRELKNKKLKK